VPHKIIQKDVTFDMSFVFSLWGAGKALSFIKSEYNVEQIKKSWSWKRPLSITVVARINIKHEVDITKMREKQHELLSGREN